MGNLTYQGVIAMHRYRKALAALWIWTGMLGAGLSPAGAADLNDVPRLSQEYRRLCQAGKYREALPVAENWLAACEAALEPGHLEIATAANALAEAHRELGQYAKAEPHYRRALAIRENRLGAGHEDVATVLNNLGLLYVGQSRLAEAEAVHKRALAIRERRLGAEHEYVGISLSNLSMLYATLRRQAEAETTGRRALAIFEKVNGPEHYQVAVVLNNLADIYTSQGRYAEAEPLYQRSIRIREKVLGKEHISLALAMGNLAALYWHQGRLGEAEPLFIRALNLAVKAGGPKHPMNAALLNNLGLIYRHQGKFDKAEQVQRAALNLRIEQLGKNHPDVALSLNNLATLLQAQERYAQAEDVMEQALAIYREALGNQHPLVGNAMNNLAEICRMLGKLEEAEALFGEAIAIHAKNRSSGEVAAPPYFSRALLRWDAGRQDEALADMAKAVELVESQRTQYAGGEQERAKAFGRYLRLYEMMIGWQSERGNVAGALEAFERAKARSLADQIQLQGVDLFAGMPPRQAQELRARERANQERAAQLEKAIANARAALGTNSAEPRGDARQTQLDALLEEFGEVRDEAAAIYRDIRTSSPAWRMMVRSDFLTLRLQELQAWLSAQQSVLLEYYAGLDHVYLLVVPPEGEARVVRLEADAELAADLGIEAGPLNRARLAKILKLDGRTISEAFKPTQTDEAALERRLAGLWQVLIPAAQRKALAEGKYRRMAIVPDAGLVNLPFDALVVETAESNGGETKFLLDVGPPIAIGPSATLLHNLATRESSAAAGRGVLSVGNPAYRRAAAAPMTAGARYAGLHGELAPLPYTGWEVQWVAEHFRPVGMATEILTKQAATERAVREGVPGRSIVHLACHGLSDQTHGNLFGALALTPGSSGAADPSNDGFLTLAEIYELNLGGCELAILSACETNLGPQQEGEGVFALSRGFLVAGARRVVASNWIVDDESSASLVSAFCSSLAKRQRDGKAMDYADALHEAKRWVRKQAKWQSPYYWGAFVLVGPP